LAITPDGTRLLAVNSPNGTLSVFQLSIGAPPKLIAEIPVGLEPVSVALRNNNEAWVANWLSDSISIVDLATGGVVKTMDVGDEPTDILFAGSTREMAFVCVSGGTSLLTGVSVDQLGHGQIKVFDPANPSLSPSTIEIPAKQPRALARNADGSRVFVSVFESGNQTTVVKETDVTANGGLPPPNPPLAPGLPPAPKTALIVKRVGAQWVDELGRSWNASIPYTLADSDIFIINSSSASLPTTTSASVTGVGTHIGNMAFDSAQSRLLVANLDDINQVRFEPNLSGKFQNNRITILTNAATGTPVVSATPDLNQHVNFGTGGSESERSLSLAMPGDLVRKSDGTYFIAATSSARVGVLANDGSVTDRIAVGQGPTGLTLDESRQALYVLNRFDQTISVVDINAKTQSSQVSIGMNPESSATRNGRRFLYDANFSAHGTVSCASCHLNGHRDGMVWDLGNPLGSVDPVNTFLPPGITGTDNLHPMKGPMMTQSLRGIIGNEPLHWRGDRAGFENFNGAFVSLLGGPGLLTSQQMADFKAFVLAMKYPPNPNQGQTRSPNEFNIGFSFFSVNRLFGGTINCSECHLIQNFQTGTDNKITPATPLVESQSVKVPQLRGIYQKVGLHRDQTSAQITGFGLAHDGTFDTLFNFMKAPQFNFASAGDPFTADSWRRDMEQMILRLDTGTPPAVGLMATVDATNKSNSTITNRISLLMNQAGVAQNNCDLVVHGLYGGTPRSFLFSNGMFLPDSLTEAPASLQTLIASVGTRAELTFLGVPKGEGRLRSIDVDNNGILNDDEPRTTVQIRGRVLNSSGNGVSGVTVTMSGSQSASATTDSNGNVIFNLVSMNGTTTLTPTQGSTTFGPSSRTFSGPVGNQIAIFTTPANGTFTTPLGPSNNVIDSTASFVSQHYQDFLTRDPDAAGFAFWQNQINSCGNDAACVELRRINVSGAFYLAIEFQETGGIVYRATLASFGTMPRFNQFFVDSAKVGRNVVVNQTGWEALLEGNKVAFYKGWVQLPNFLTAFPSSMTAAQFVDKLDQNAGGVLSPTERTTLISVLGAAPSDITKRASVLRSLVEDADFKAKEVNRAFVLMQYFGYLRRNPDDPPDNNLEGFNFWLTKLNQHNGNFVDAEMVKSFIVSGEYRQRFGP
jgi:YVTN family beta-propeller protein